MLVAYIQPHSEYSARDLQQLRQLLESQGIPMGSIDAISPQQKQLLESQGIPIGSIDAMAPQQREFLESHVLPIGPIDTIGPQQRQLLESLGIQTGPIEPDLPGPRQPGQLPELQAINLQQLALLLEREHTHKTQNAARLSNAPAKRDTYERQLNTVQRQLDAVHGERTVALAERDTIKRQLDTVQRQLDAVQGERTAALAERDTYRRQLDTVQGERAAALAERDTYKRQLDTVQSKLNTTLAERDTYKKQLYAVQRQLDTAQTRPNISGHATLPPIVPIRIESHFVRPTNKMHELLTGAEAHPEQEKDALQEAAFIACRTLRELLAEPDYLEVVRTLTGDRNQYMRAFETVTGDPDQFLKFVLAEHQVLTASGLSAPAATGLVIECQNVIGAMRTGKVDPCRISKAIESLSEQACSLAMRLREQAQKQESSRRTRRILKRVLVGGVGAIVVGIINTYAAGLPDFGPVFSSTSVAFAGALAALPVDLIIAGE